MDSMDILQTPTDPFVDSAVAVLALILVPSAFSDPAPIRKEQQRVRIDGP